MQKNAFVLVGHSNWGKSQTLRELTQGDVKTRHLKIPEIDKKLFGYIRRISNDDNETALLKFSQGLALRIKQDYLILTLCPKIDPSKKTKIILTSLNKVYKLHFFVLLNDYAKSRKITISEINFLRRFGLVSILYKHCERKKRAIKFAAFVKKHVRS